jgi:hypothetical protein
MKNEETKEFFPLAFSAARFIHDGGLRRQNGRFFSLVFSAVKFHN